MQFYTGKMIHRFHCLWMFFNRSFPQSVDKRKRRGSGKKFDGKKVDAKKSEKLSPNCAAIVDNSNCALLDLEQTVLCSAGRRKAQKGMCWIDENAMP